MFNAYYFCIFVKNNVMNKVIPLKKLTEVKCFKYNKQTNCDGTLHSIAPIYYTDDPLNYKYKCKCDKCGIEIVLNFDPDQY